MVALAHFNIHSRINPLDRLQKQFILGGKFGDNPTPNLGLLIFSVVMFSIIGLFVFMRLNTEIDEKEIRINFFPLTKKVFKWHTIKKAEVLNYGFVGGWGIRIWTKYGTVYNTKGNKGLAIELYSGKNI
ncbi:hypothetical protein GSB9_01775 [Flavobacteriaceae bacterium GSB9]|nr:hypothetical protein GSB9_01775 [Flavobacteriaceae bacterium GSB9]